MPRPFKDRTGERYNRLTAIEYISSNVSGSRWKWRCDCGNIITPQTGAVTWGRTKSCGCLNDERRKSGLNRLQHGDAKRGIRKKIYMKWASMLARCRNAHTKAYRYYGKQGVKVCKEWLIYENFRDWAYENGYTDDLTIDRISNDKGYNPKNCRFVTKKEQARNKKNTRTITYNNKTQCIGAWAEKLGVSHATLYGLFYRKNFKRINKMLKELKLTH